MPSKGTHKHSRKDEKGSSDASSGSDSGSDSDSDEKVHHRHRHEPPVAAIFFYPNGTRMPSDETKLELPENFLEIELEDTEPDYDSTPVLDVQLDKAIMMVNPSL